MKLPWRRRDEPGGAVGLRRLGEPAADERSLRGPRRPGQPRRDAALLRRQPLRPGTRERPRPQRLPRAVDGLPHERQLHGAALLDRRLQARQRRVGDGHRAVLQLRQGRQEGRAARLDPRPRVRRCDRGGRRRPRRHDGPARAADPGLLPRAGGRSLRACRCSATRSAATGSPTSVVVSPDAGFAKKARRFARRLGAPLAIADKERSEHDESPKVVEIIGDVAGRDARHRRRLHDQRRDPRRGCRAARRTRRPFDLRRGHARRLRTGLDGRDSTPARSRGSTSPTRSRRSRSPSARKCGSCRWRRSSREAIRRIHNRESISSLFREGTSTVGDY